MISVIMASSNIQMLKDVSLNIEQTIGVPFEILSYQNHGGKKGLCEIYNQLTSKAKFDYLCFMHEDVEILTTNWGVIIERIFKDELIGIIGIAGSAYKSLSPSSWFCSGNADNINFINLIQGYKFAIKDPKLLFHNQKEEGSAQVVVVDGVWFCTRKAIVSKFPFDEHLLKGFHGYDIDFSLQVTSEYTGLVTFDILMKHFSEGNFNFEWIRETVKLQDKWKDKLPRYFKDISKSQRINIEKHTFRYFMNKMYAADYTKKEIIKVLNTTKLARFNFFLYLKLLKEVIGLKKVSSLN